MGKRYEKEFKEMIVGLLQAGHSPLRVAIDYGLDQSMIRKWRKVAEGRKEPFTGKGNPSLTLEEKEIRELKKKLREAEMERDILKKAVTIFSKSDRTNTGL